ncbi:extracellular solute-binding protein [Tenggerimyces flavus]|uniref:Extracellular solute-binding protein n=1 Tax=Tenggerimyces flavus TaxID=1708749 RepID=A0ABV7YNA1_9ACTN|nr:extracellular solute-binding protein [Tenggerimyces flavus]MBM7786241.1 putative aldouronate transport system substrate-binding protein [Tenggerimyces flavus]
MSPGSMNRRTVLRAIGGVTAATALPTLLGACSGGPASKPNTSTSNAKVQLPTFVPYEGVKPDLAPTTDGIQAGFLSYPAEPVAGLTEKPGSGGALVAMVSNPGPIPPVNGNRYLQSMAQVLNVDLKPRFIPLAEYTSKLATVVASDDIPDFLQLLGVGRVPELLRAKFADLTDYLSGDAVKEYPFLANLPTESWRTCVFNGGIYGLPIPRAAVGPLMYYRADLLAEKGLNGNPNSFEEFRTLCRELTDERSNKWACVSPNGVKIFVQQMLGVPTSDWQEKDGTFTNIWELPETEQAIGVVADLWKDGVFHPDSLSGSIDAKTTFIAGTVSVHYDNYTAWSGYAQQALPSNADFRLEGMLPPNFDGSSERSLWKGYPSYSTAVIKKASKERVTELLRVANALAAPFGTKEYLQFKLGVEGVHYTKKGTDPAPTSTGTAEVATVLNYLASPPAILYEPGNPELTKQEHAYQQKAIPIANQSPTLGLYSNTQGSQGAQLTQAMTDAQNEIITGRKPISTWKDAVRDWKQKGGDKVRSEYAESFAASQ